MSLITIEDEVWTHSSSIPFRAAANDQLELQAYQFVIARNSGVVAQRYR